MKTTSWADGFGVWHVRVSRDESSPMRTARLVLAAEIRERDIHADVHVWLFPVFVRSMCDAATVVYRERLNDER